MLKGKKVLLAITGSIAAYKSAELVRLLIKQGSSVRVLMTPSSINFVTPLTLSTLSKSPVLSDFTDKETSNWNNHVDLALWADLMIIAPLTANTLAKMVNGECDNLVLATYLSAKCPAYFAPAMDLDMYKHPSTMRNIKKLQDHNSILIPSGFGELASGLNGEGRMAEPFEIIKAINDHLLLNSPLYNKKVLVTAGPTYEPIDPVRYIGNRSSGKMGCLIARNFAEKGAFVDLVLGPSSINYEHPNLNIHKIETCAEMYNKVDQLFSNNHISVFAAAVSDYSPLNFSAQKIKKDSDSLVLNLKKNTDILSTMSKKRSKDQYIVGFALETENETENAIKKLKEKKLDMIVLNSLNNKGAGFELDTNKITIIEKDNSVIDFDLKNKKEVANDLVNEIIKKYNA